MSRASRVKSRAAVYVEVLHRATDRRSGRILSGALCEALASSGVCRRRLGHLPRLSRRPHEGEAFDVYVGRLRVDVERVDLVGDRAPSGVDLLDVVGELLLEFE